MTEMVWTDMHIGGKINQEQIEELANLANDIFSCGDALADIKDAIGKNEHVYFAEEVNYGNPDELVDFCKKHELAFMVSWGAKCGAFNAGVQLWTPELAAKKAGTNKDGLIEAPADDDGDAMLSAYALRNMLACGKTLLDAVEYLDQFSYSKLPALTTA